MKSKFCSKCKTLKSFSSFHKDKSAKDGYFYWCKLCKSKLSKIRYSNPEVKKQCAENSKRWAEKNPEKYEAQQRKSHLMRHYGLSVEDYNELFEQQQGCCAICGKHQSKIKYRLDVEHNHKTGKVRSLTCTTCNKLINVYEKEFYGLKDKIKDYLEAE